MTTQDLNAMINSEILNYFSSFDTCKGRVNEDDGVFSIDFTNNIDSSHTVNEKHARNSAKMQKVAGQFYYAHNLTAEEKKKFANFQEWHESAGDEQKKVYYDFENDFMNYSIVDGGHDDLWLFSVVWKIRHQKNGVFVDICDDIHHYAFFPKFERADAKTIEVRLNVSCNIKDELAKTLTEKLFSK